MFSINTTTEWCDNVTNQIDIASEILLLEYSDYENLKNMINLKREEMIVKVKEIEQFNLSNNEQKFVYFIQVYKSNKDDLMEIKQKRSLLGNLVLLNQDLSHLFNNLR